MFITSTSCFWNNTHQMHSLKSLILHKISYFPLLFLWIDERVIIQPGIAMNFLPRCWNILKFSRQIFSQPWVNPHPFLSVLILTLNVFRTASKFCLPIKLKAPFSFKYRHPCEAFFSVRYYPIRVNYHHNFCLFISNEPMVYRAQH